MTPNGRRLAISALLVLAGLSFAAPHARAAVPALDKIAPWVFQNATFNSPAEFFVVLDDQADLTPAAALPGKAAKGRFVHDALWAKAQATQAPLRAWLDENHVQYQPFYIVNAILVTATLDVAEKLAARADVARIEGNPVLQPLEPVQLTPEESAAIANPPYAIEAVEPGVTSIRAPEVWATGVTGQGIVVGGADTGVRWDHASLKGHYRGWDGLAAHHDYNWHDAIHTTGGGACGHDIAAPCDDYGHGTHTLGTAVGGDSSGVNQIGVAPGAKFIACRNMDVGNGTPARYIECMEWFLAPYPVGGTPAQGDPAMAPDITTNSWGCPASEGCAPATLQAAVEAQRAAGIMFVAAAGNSGPSCSTVSDPPSFYDATYTVGAYSSSTGTIASFSSRGPATADGSGRMKPDIMAPGVSVRSCLSSGVTNYGTMNGTSMATPHVAGAIALLWSAFPGLRHDIAHTEDLLNQSAVHVSSTLCDAAGGFPNNAYGWGRLDVRAATLTPLLAVDPAAPARPQVAAVSLAPAFPNPARHSTLVRMTLAREAACELAVFSSDGRRVRMLARGTFAAGERTLTWNGLDDRGAAVAPAVYHVRLLSRGETASQKVIWLGN